MLRFESVTPSPLMSNTVFLRYESAPVIVTLSTSIINFPVFSKLPAKTSILLEYFGSNTPFGKYSSISL